MAEKHWTEKQRLKDPYMQDNIKDFQLRIIRNMQGKELRVTA